jgi:hypothetical protein
MDLTDWQGLHDRLDQAHRNYLAMDSYTRDLWRMHRTVYELLREADREWVNCRRRGAGSPRFDQLLAEAEEALKTFEGYIIIGKLSRKDWS